MARHCGKCELPMPICACAEAEAYDKANPLIEKPQQEFEQVGWLVWNTNNATRTSDYEFGRMNESITEADKEAGFRSKPLYVRKDNA